MLNGQFLVLLYHKRYGIRKNFIEFISRLLFQLLHREDICLEGKVNFPNLITFLKQNVLKSPLFINVIR